MEKVIHTEHDIDTYIIKELILLALEHEEYKTENMSALSKMIFGVADTIRHDSEKIVELLCEYGDDIDNRYNLCPTCKEQLEVHTDYSGIEYCGFETSMEEYNRVCPNGCDNN